MREPVSPRSARGPSLIGRTVVLALLTLAAAGVARAGHEITFYPSFYPQEITLKPVDPHAAARGLAKSELQAYVGPDPFTTAAAPDNVRYADSLGGFATLTFDAAKAAFHHPLVRCAAGARVRQALGAAGGGFVAHAYPVTPFHPDWLSHWDLARAALAPPVLGLAAASAPAAEAARQSMLAGTRRLLVKLVKAPPRFAEALSKGGITVVDADADATVAIVDTRTLLDTTRSPWAKEGWFQAAQLYPVAEQAPDRDAVVQALARRERGQYADATERVELERRIVLGLTGGCARVPLGYLVRREAYSAEYSNGVENVAWDSEAGLRSAIFLRTVKLKDFMWNGWLTLGVAEPLSAAWNPVAGFTDSPGRLLWTAVGDPATVPSPYGAGWLANRVDAREFEAGPIMIPADALAPDPTTGVLRRLGPGQSATARILYRVLLSKFHDGDKMTMADILAPYAFAVRWAARDAEVARASALARDRVAAVRPLRIDAEIKDLGDLQLFYDVALVEVYLRGEGAPAAAAAAVAPPWSAVPWQVAALMDEAVVRGWAALSEREARRRGVPWLDLARDARLRSRLMALAEDRARRAGVPEALRVLVTPAEARARWATLRRFVATSGHLLDANGPYRLGKVTSDSVVLGVFRDFSYPIGIGSFDRWALPHRAYITHVDSTSQGLTVTADVESIEKFERSYRILRGPFRPAPAGEAFKPAPPVVHYVAIDMDGRVRAVGVSDHLDGDKLSVALDTLAPGAYRIMLAVTLDDNRMNPEITVVPWTRS